MRTSRSSGRGRSPGRTRWADASGSLTISLPIAWLGFFEASVAYVQGLSTTGSFSQLLNRMVFPPTMTSVHRSNRSGLFVGDVETYSHGFTVTPPATGNARLAGPFTGETKMSMGGLSSRLYWLGLNSS